MNGGRLKNKKEAIIIDLDGTVAKAQDRDYMEMGEKLLDDLPNESLIQMIDCYVKHEKVYPIFVTGRSESSRKYSNQWIKKHFKFSDFSLFMREQNDFRQDFIIKKEIYQNQIQEKYQVLIVFEDRIPVVQMYRNDLNLFVLQTQNTP